MKFLENRIPPPLVLLFSLLLIKGVSMLSTASANTPANTQTEMDYLAWIGGALAVLGICIAVLGVREFRKAQTTVNPLDPSRASNLVTSGVFGLSRNPMYLGMLLVTIGYSVALAKPLSMLVVVMFALYINRWQIIPEERAIRKLFGQEFDDYCAKTRRWI